MSLTRIVGIRTHRFGSSEITLHDALSEYFDKDRIVFVIDETHGSVTIPDNYKKVGFDRTKLRQLGLFFDCPRIGWLCGDYFYYCLAEHRFSDEYWLIEPDVRFTFPRPGKFFEDFESVGADFLAPRLSERTAHWPWYRRAKVVAENVYGCAFPITRLRAHAIPYLLAERQRVTQVLESSGQDWRHYPNDESFVTTSLAAGGFVLANMTKIKPDYFTHFSTVHAYPLEKVLMQLPADKVVHSVREGDEFWSAFRRQVVHSLQRSHVDKTWLKNELADFSRLPEIIKVLQAAQIEGDETFNYALVKIVNECIAECRKSSRGH